MLSMQDKPKWMKGHFFFLVYITGNSQDDLEKKKDILNKIFRQFKGSHIAFKEGLKNFFLEKPIFYATTADFRKGGGFKYVGAMMPLEKIPTLLLKGMEISEQHGIIPTMGCRVIGKGHNILF